MRTLFLAEIDMPELERMASLKVIENVKSFNIIETFIESFAQEREIFQMLSISQLGKETGPVFSKDIFKWGRAGFVEITKRSIMSSEEYYEKLLKEKPDLVELKFRFSFEHRDMNYAVEKHDDFVVVQVESDENKDPFKNLKCIEPIKQVNMGLEEVFYKHYNDLL